MIKQDWIKMTVNMCHMVMVDMRIFGCLIIVNFMK